MSQLSVVVETLRVASTNSELNGTLSELGTLLRDANIRSSAEVQGLIPQLIDIANSQFTLPREESVQGLLESFRVLINCSADNETNRNLLARSDTESKNQFWQYIVEIFSSKDEQLIDVCDRILLFLPQFIHATECSEEYIRFFTDVGLIGALFNYVDVLNRTGNANVQASVDEEFLDAFCQRYENVLELLCTASTIVEPHRSLLTPGSELRKSNIVLEACTSILQFFNNTNNVVSIPSVLGEVLDYASQLLYHGTLIDDCPALAISNIHEILLNILQLIPSQGIENVTMIKRRLFSTSGNVTSMPSYDNFKDTDLNISIITGQYDKFGSNRPDSYVASAAAIGLGNSIVNKQLQLKMVEVIGKSNLAEFTTRFFQIGFIDVIQYQSLHLMSNLMTTEVARTTLTNSANYGKLLQITKAIIDNSKYYKEVSSVYFKFLKKLIRVGFLEVSGEIAQEVDSSQGRLDVIEFDDLWQYLDNNDSKMEVAEIKFLLLQSTIRTINADKIVDSLTLEHLQFFRKLIDNAVSDTSASPSIPIHFMLEKLKTIGITLQTFLKTQVTPSILLSTVYQGDLDNYNQFFWQHLTRFLVELGQFLQSQQSQQTGTVPQFQVSALVNNSKFVAASALTFCEKCAGDMNETIDACKAIINIS